jgi:polar amino acid transport system permease protein
MPAQSIWTLLSWGPDGWSDDIASGVLVTIALALATLPIGLVIGFFVAFAKQHEEPSLRLAGNIYRQSLSREGCRARVDPSAGGSVSYKVLS